MSVNLKNHFFSSYFLGEISRTREYIMIGRTYITRAPIMRVYVLGSTCGFRNHYCRIACVISGCYAIKNNS